MKKILFFLCVALSLLLFINVAGIILLDADKLTCFGWGMLAGRLFLLAGFMGLSFVLFGKTYGKGIF